MGGVVAPLRKLSRGACDRIETIFMKQNGTPAMRAYFTWQLPSKRMPTVCQTIVCYQWIQGPISGPLHYNSEECPANCVYLGSFEEIKRRAALSRNCKPEELPAATVLGAAGTGGLIYWSTVYPIDVCKSAIMTVPSSFFLSIPSILGALPSQQVCKH